MVSDRRAEERAYELQELTEAIAELKAGAEDVDAQVIVMSAAEDVDTLRVRGVQSGMLIGTAIADTAHTVTLALAAATIAFLVVLAIRTWWRDRA